MKSNQKLTSTSSRLIKGINKVIEKEKPDAVIVQGDTLTAMIASLVAFFNQIKVFHVEAGLRTNNIYSPFPEELNRKIISLISYLNFSPTKNNAKNLKNENNTNKIFVCGNTVIDAIKYIDKIKLNKVALLKLEKNFNFLNFNEKYILVTIHRRENFKHVSDFCEMLKRILNKFPNVKIIFSVHKNPNVKKIIEKKLKNIKNLFLINSQNYLNFVYLIKKCFFIISDSGGLQEEVTYFAKPIIVFRETTEREEIKNKNSVIVTTNLNKIFYKIENLIHSKRFYQKYSNKNFLFGRGDSSEKIIKLVLQNLK
jgi:UDP-N-acetylglucosamine 2-epimerase (non-hydrolysing)